MSNILAKQISICYTDMDELLSRCDIITDMLNQQLETSGDFRNITERVIESRPDNKFNLKFTIS